jgi:hypothetical protein
VSSSATQKESRRQPGSEPTFGTYGSVGRSMSMPASRSSNARGRTPPDSSVADDGVADDGAADDGAADGGAADGSASS